MIALYTGVLAQRGCSCRQACCEDTAVQTCLVVLKLVPGVVCVLQIKATDVALPPGSCFVVGHSLAVSLKQEGADKKYVSCLSQPWTRSMTALTAKQLLHCLLDSSVLLSASLAFRGLGVRTPMMAYDHHCMAAAE